MGGRKSRASTDTKPPRQAKRRRSARPENLESFRRRRFWTLVAEIGGVGLALFGAYVGWVSIQPVITVEVQPSLEAGEEFSPRFVIRNTGYATARYLAFNCAEIGLYERGEGAIWPRQWESAQPPIEGPEYDHIGTLEPGSQAVRRCRVRRLPPPGFRRVAGSRLIPIVDFESRWSPWTSHQSHIFEAVQSEGGIVWQFMGSGLSDEQAEWMRKRGHTIVTATSGSDRLEFSGPEDR